MSSLTAVSFPLQCDAANPNTKGVFNKDETNVGVKECEDYI
jgi:hypothetical protein